MSVRRARRAPFSLFAFQDIITSVTGVIILLTVLLTLELVRHETILKTRGNEQSADPLLAAIGALDDQIKAVTHQLRVGKSDIDQLADLPAGDVARQRNILRQDVERLRQEVNSLSQQSTRSQSRRETLAAAQNSPGGKPDDLSAARKRVEALREQLNSLKTSRSIVYNPNPHVRKQGWLVDLSPELLRVARVGQKSSPVVFDVRSNNGRVQAVLDWARARNRSSDYFILLVRPNTVKTYGQLYTGLDDLGFDIGFDLLGSDDKAIDPTTGAVF